MTLHKPMSMGEVTASIQGYPTQIWEPVDVRNPLERNLAILHDRPPSIADSDAFFIPGNRPDKLILPGTEQYIFDDASDVRRLRVPDALLWQNHGGPCEKRGAKYRRVGANVMQRIYTIVGDGRSDTVIIPGSILSTRHDYRGPFDFQLTDDNGQLVERLVLEPMNIDLIRNQTT